MANLKQHLAQVEEIFAREQFIAEPHELYEPIDYTLRLGGKRIRPTLLLAACEMFGGNTAMAADAALGIETFHNFTLLHDDLMDRSPLRRGKPTVYTRWGDNTAILSGDTMYALAWRYFLRQPAQRLHEVLQCFNETAIEVCEGQQKDMNFEQMALDAVSLDDYRDMIRQKTAVLLAGALKIGALYANAPEADTIRLHEYGIHMGLAFQLQDDLLDGYGDTAVFGKQTGQDIRDNKKTFLPLMALVKADEAQRRELKQIFAAKDNIEAEEKVRRTMEIYNQLNLRETIETEIENEFQHARGYLDDIRVDETRKTALREMLATLNDRKK